MKADTIDSVLEQIRRKLNLSKEHEWELLTEIRVHLEDAVADARARGSDETVALLKAAEDFGIDESAAALHTVHAEWALGEVILACILPIVGVITLRWLLFAADGTAGGWQPIFGRPPALLVAALVLLLPLGALRRRPFALAVWLVFWLLSALLIAFPGWRSW